MADFFTPLFGGVALLGDPITWVLVLVGTLYGVACGAMPGVGTTLAYGLVLPFTFAMTPIHGVAFLLAISVGVQYGNSIPAILMGIPGNPAAILTVIDGHTLHKRGESGLALGVAFVAALGGQLVSILMFIMLVVPLMGLAYYFSYPEIFALYCLGMVALISLTGDNVVKGADVGHVRDRHRHGRPRPDGPDDALRFRLPAGALGLRRGRRRHRPACDQRAAPPGPPGLQLEGSFRRARPRALPRLQAVAARRSGHGRRDRGRDVGRRDPRRRRDHRRDGLLPAGADDLEASGAFRQGLDRGDRRQRGGAERVEFRRADPDARARPAGQRLDGAPSQRAHGAGLRAGSADGRPRARAALRDDRRNARFHRLPARRRLAHGDPHAEGGAAQPAARHHPGARHDDPRHLCAAEPRPRRRRSPSSAASSATS